MVRYRLKLYTLTLWVNITISSWIFANNERDFVTHRDLWWLECSRKKKNIFEFDNTSSPNRSYRIWMNERRIEKMCLVIIDVIVLINTWLKWSISVSRISNQKLIMTTIEICWKSIFWSKSNSSWKKIHTNLTQPLVEISKSVTIQSLCPRSIVEFLIIIVEYTKMCIFACETQNVEKICEY